MEFPAYFEADPIEDNPEMVTVTIPGLGSNGQAAVTCGSNLAEARRMAVDLVDTWLVLHDDLGDSMPAIGKLPKKKGWEMVRPSLRIQWSLTLRRLRRELGISQVEAARRLGVNQSVYSRLEDPKKCNPTLQTLEKVAKAFSVTLELISLQVA